MAVEIEIETAPLFFLEKIKKGKLNEFAEITDIKFVPISKSHGYALLKLRIDTIEIAGKKFFNNVPIIVGSEIEISEKAKLSGTIIEIGEAAILSEKIEKKTVKKRVLVKTFNIRPWVAEKITVGKSEIDSLSGEKIATILKKTEKPAEIILETETGEIVTQLHPLHKDVEIELEINTLELRGENYFKNNKVLVGSQIILEFDDTVIQAEMLDILE